MVGAFARQSQQEISPSTSRDGVRLIEHERPVMEIRIGKIDAGSLRVHHIAAIVVLRAYQLRVKCRSALIDTAPSK